MTAEQQAITLQLGELQAARGQVLALTQSHDQLRQAHDAFNAEAELLFPAQADTVRAAEDRLRDLIFRQQFDPLDPKDLKPEGFKGRKTENFKPWAKKFKACVGRS